MVWLNAATGLIGIEDDDPANLLHVGVLAIGFIGAIIARLQPRGLARAVFTTALAHVSWRARTRVAEHRWLRANPRLAGAAP